MSAHRFPLPPSVRIAEGGRPPVRAVQWGFDRAGLDYTVIATAPTHVTVRDPQGRRRRATVVWGAPWCRITKWRPA